MVELHYVQFIRMKPEEADGGLPRILSGLTRLNNGEAFRPPVEDPGLSGAGAFYKSFSSNPFAIEKRPLRAIFRIQMSLMQNPNRTLLNQIEKN